MRRNYISPEYKYVPAYGTYNMVEQTSFFGSKMLEIEDLINISNENIIYYQSDIKEQISYLLEKNLQPIVYSTVSDKKTNHTITLGESQSELQKSQNARWVIKIDLKTILTNYLFATLKKHRTFEGVKNNMTIYNNIDFAITEYINKNVLNRYKYSSLQFFVNYKSFSQADTLKHDNTFTEISNTTLITSKAQVLIDSDGKNLTIIFNQEKNASEYNFDYYFNLVFEKV